MSGLNQKEEKVLNNLSSVTSVNIFKYFYFFPF